MSKQTQAATPTRRTMLQSLVGLPARTRSRPNILFFLTDDQRFDAMSCAGNRYLKTPNLDRIAAGGIRFAEAFVTNSLCAPSRASILTGLYSHAHGVRTNSPGSHALRPGQATFATLLRKAGYHTAMVGKWHIASKPEGFDDWCILPGQGAYHDPEMIVNGKGTQFQGYVDDVIAGRALDVLAGRPKDKPFCLLCWFKAPHRSWKPAARFANAFSGVEFPEPATFRESLASRPTAIRNSDIQIADMPDFKDQGVARSWPRERRAKENYQHFMRAYYRTLLGVDENVGCLLDALDRQGIAENTIVLHAADNGFFHGEYGLFDKRMMYEPSIRIPLLLRYPAAIRAGQVDRSHMVLHTDVFPTLLDYAGVERPAATLGHGASLRPLLEGRARAPWRDAWLYEYFEYPAITCTGKMRGVRTTRWKLIHYIQQPAEYELFDLRNDPEERRNVYGQAEHANTAAELRRRLEQLRTELGDDRSEDGTTTQPCTIRIAELPA